MRCEEVQQALCLPQTGLRGLWSARLVHHHLMRCRYCADFKENLIMIEQGIDSWRAKAAPSELRARIAATLPASHGSPVPVSVPPMARIGRRVLTLAVAVGAIGALLLATVHNDPANAALKRMQEAVAAVRNAHIRLYSKTPAGALHQWEEEWYQQGRWRKEGDYGTRLIVGKTYWRYLEKQHRLISLQETGKQISDFSIQALTAEVMGTETSFTPRTLAETQEGGRAMLQVLLEPSDAKQRDPNNRHLYWIDEATHLPIRLEGQDRKEGEWSTSWRMAFEFNQDLPGTLFDPQHLSDAAKP